MEHHNGHGIYSPTILGGLGCHTKTLRREIVLKIPQSTKNILDSKAELLWWSGYFVPVQRLTITHTPLQSGRNKHRKWGNVLICGQYGVPVRETHQGDIRHGVDHYSLVLHCVLSDSPKARFQHVVPVEERLFCSRFHPHLKLNMSQCFSWWYNWVQLHLFVLCCHWKTVYIICKQELNTIPSMHLSKHHYVIQRSKRLEGDKS